MNRIILLICFVHISYCTFAQEKAIAKIHYQFKHVNDTNKRDQPLRDEVVLFLGKDASFYQSYSEYRVKESIASQKILATYDGNLTLYLGTTAIKNFYLIYPKRQQIVDMESISSSFDAYFTILDYESPQWELDEETQIIDGYVCQKARTFFKGRNYIAWFTTDIPFQAGPWKLSGLPGLILSAYDEFKEVVFDYEGFSLLSKDEPILIEIPYYAIEANKEEIDKQRHVFLTEQSKYFQVLSASGRMALANSFYGIDYTLDAITLEFDESYKPSFQENNPIELTK